MTSSKADLIKSSYVVPYADLSFLKFTSYKDIEEDERCSAELSYLQSLQVIYGTESSDIEVI